MIKKLLEEREILRNDYIALAKDKNKMIMPANYDFRRAYLLLAIFPSIFIISSFHFLVRIFETIVNLHSAISSRN